MAKNSAPPPQTPTWVSWLQLVRLPAVFTAWADIGMGFALSLRVFENNQWRIEDEPKYFVLGLLLVATTGLYWAGMILNDIYDIEQDRKERPSRPLPSGRISMRAARVAGFVLLGVGIIAATIAGLIQFQTSIHAIQTGTIALVLAGAIWLYDAIAKQTAFAPVVMGSCRMLNVLMAMSVAAPQSLVFRGDGVFEFSNAALLIAGGFGVYIAGVTWFAWREGSQSHRPELVSSTLLMLVGVVLICMFPTQLPEFAEQRPKIFLPNDFPWPFVMLILSLMVLRACGTAIATVAPEHVQTAVKTSLLTLIIYNAAITAVAVDVIPGAIIALLAIPALFLGKWLYST